jgi:lipoprotein signal peptidase
MNNKNIADSTVKVKSVGEIISNYIRKEKKRKEKKRKKKE